MIDQFSIFHRGGGVLWERTLTAITGSPIDSLIQNVLLEERAASTSFRHDKYVLKWTFSNDLELVFVAVHLHVANLLYVDQLLDRVKDAFTALVKPHWEEARKAYQLPAVKFDKKFDRILAQFEMSSLAAKRGPRTFEEANKPTTAANNGSSARSASKKQSLTADGEGDNAGEASEGSGGVKSDEDGEKSSSAVTNGADAAAGANGSGSFNPDKLRAMQQAMMRGPRQMRAGPPSKKKSKEGKETPDKEGTEEDGKKKRVKQATKWLTNRRTQQPQHSPGCCPDKAPPRYFLSALLTQCCGECCRCARFMCVRDDKISREDAKALDFSRKAAGGGSEEESKAQELSGVELAKKSANNPHHAHAEANTINGPYSNNAVN